MWSQPPEPPLIASRWCHQGCPLAYLRWPFEGVGGLWGPAHSLPFINECLYPVCALLALFAGLFHKVSAAASRNSLKKPKKLKVECATETWLEGFDSHMVTLSQTHPEEYHQSVMETLFSHSHVQLSGQCKWSLLIGWTGRLNTIDKFLKRTIEQNQTIFWLNLIGRYLSRFTPLESS